MLSGTLAGFHANSTVSGLITTISGLSIGSRGGTEIEKLGLRDNVYVPHLVRWPT